MARKKFENSKFDDDRGVREGSKKDLARDNKERERMRIEERKRKDKDRGKGR